MALLSPSTKMSRAQIRLNINNVFLENINAYCQWADIQDEAHLRQRRADLLGTNHGNVQRACQT